jgi:hypothetical protein
VEDVQVLGMQGMIIPAFVSLLLASVFAGGSHVVT